jgi:hypothetical protein
MVKWVGHENISQNAKGWSKPVENTGMETCDIDGAKLWIGPGEQIYCNLEHDFKSSANPTAADK